MPQILTNHISLAGAAPGTNPVQQGAETVVAGADDRMDVQPGQANPSQLFWDQLAQNITLGTPVFAIMAPAVASIGRSRAVSLASARTAMRAAATTLSKTRTAILAVAREGFRVAALAAIGRTRSIALGVAKYGWHVPALAITTTRTVILASVRDGFRVPALAAVGRGSRAVTLTPAHSAFVARPLTVAIVPPSQAVAIAIARTALRSVALDSVAVLPPMAPVAPTRDSSAPWLYHVPTTMDEGGRRPVRTQMAIRSRVPAFTASARWSITHEATRTLAMRSRIPEVRTSMRIGTRPVYEDVLLLAMAEEAF